MITENFEFLLFFGGYFLIELVFFLILIYLLVKNRNSQEKHGYQNLGEFVIQ